MLVVAVLSLKYHWASTPSIVLAYVIGTIVSYIGSGVFAFRQPMTGVNLSKFLIVVGLSFILNVVISELLSPLGIQAVIIGAINVCVVGVFNFITHKLWTFK